jgi:hypothetical protein
VDDFISGLVNPFDYFEEDGHTITCEILSPGPRQRNVGIALVVVGRYRKVRMVS